MARVSKLADGPEALCESLNTSRISTRMLTRPCIGRENASEHGEEIAALIMQRLMKVEVKR